MNPFQLAKTVPLLDVVNYILPSLNLKKRGKSWGALCPFHQEKTPSFTVNQSMFHCFGCGQGGDSITFVSKILDVRPIQAAQLILNAFGMDSGIPSPQKQQLTERTKERELEQAFRTWERESFLRLVGFRDAIMSVFRQDGLQADDAILQIVAQYIPQIEHQIEIMAVGSDEEKVGLFMEEVDYL